MIPNPYYQEIVDTANQYGVDPNLALGVGYQESRFNPAAVSPKGARGIFQLMPETASGLGVNADDPHENIQGGVRYLRSMLDRYGGNVPLALAGYNAGPERADAFAKGGQPLPAETSDYINKITGANAPMFQAMASPMRRAMAGSPSMADNSQQSPSLAQRFFSGGPGALFGDPQPDWSLGRGLQGLGAGLIAAGGNPSGGAAMMNAANMPLFRARFSFSRDPLGNPVIFNMRTGQAYGMGADGSSFSPIGGPPGTQVGSGAAAPGRVEATAQSPAVRAQAAKAMADESQKQYEALQSSAVDAQQLKDLLEHEAVPYSQNPNVYQGKGADWWNGAKSILYKMGIDVSGAPEAEELDKINQQLVAKSLASQKGVRFAAPEIAFGRTANADMDKLPKVNQQIYETLIQNAQRSMDIAAIARRHMETYGVLGPAFHQDVANYQATHSLYNPTVIPAGPSGSGKRPPLSSFNR